MVHIVDSERTLNGHPVLMLEVVRRALGFSVVLRFMCVPEQPHTTAPESKSPSTDFLMFSNRTRNRPWSAIRCKSCHVSSQEEKVAPTK